MHIALFRQSGCGYWATETRAPLIKIEHLIPFIEYNLSQRITLWRWALENEVFDQYSTTLKSSIEY